MNLPINRFITSNYDCEIEMALHAKRGMSRPDLGLPETNRTDCGAASEHISSITQAKKYAEHLALFAMARVDAASNRSMVFHCHGRWDEPEDMVLSEADYQRWYLDDREGEGVVFRQTINLMFRSNPILFLGFGMGDEDLVRPLRIIAATAPQHRDSRPVFALMRYQKGDIFPHEKSWDYFDSLEERFGMLVIPYEVKDENEWTSTLCRELGELERNRLEWEAGALEKPQIRGLRVKAQENHPSYLYFHHRIDGAWQLLEDKKAQKKPPKSQNAPDKDTSGMAQDAKRSAAADAQVKELKEIILRGGSSKAGIKQSGIRALVILGPGGSGKSWLATQLVQDLWKDRRATARFKGFFFWSCYYADDSLTGVDYALKFMEISSGKKSKHGPPGPEPPLKPEWHKIHERALGGRFARLMTAMQDKKNRYLLV